MTTDFYDASSIGSKQFKQIPSNQIPQIIAIQNVVSFNRRQWDLHWLETCASKDNSIK